MIKSEFIRILVLNMILMVLIDIDYIRILELNLLPLEELGIINIEMKLIIF